jgi:excisionase family DNA binding protein
MQTTRKTYNVPEIAAMLGISRPSAYDLVSSAGFPAIRIGERRIVIPCEAFDKWLAEAATKR